MKLLDSLNKHKLMEAATIMAIAAVSITLSLWISTGNHLKIVILKDEF